MSTGFGNGKGSSNNRISREKKDDDTWEDKKSKQTQKKAIKTTNKAGDKYDEFKESKEGKKVQKVINRVKGFALGLMFAFFGIFFKLLGQDDPFERITQGNKERTKADACKMQEVVWIAFFFLIWIAFGVLVALVFGFFG